MNLEASRRSFRRLGTIVFRVTAATCVPRFLIDTGSTNGDFAELIAKIQLGFTDAQVVYGERQAFVPLSVGWRVVNLVCVATGPVAWLYTGLAILIWPQLSTFRRIFTAGFWAMLLIQAVAKGQNFGIFDILLQISVFLAVRQLIIKPTVTLDVGPRGSASARSQRFGNSGRGGRRSGRSRTVRLAAGVCVAVAVFVLSFSNTMKSRVGVNFESSFAEGVGSAQVNYESLAWQVLPQEVQPTVVTLTYYMTHGYSGLALARDLPFMPTFGLGSSWFVINNFQELTGVDLLDRTYQGRLQATSGYDAKVKWHTAYLWIANDVSLYGVPFALFLMMFIFGLAWKDFLVNGNGFAILMLSVFATFLGFVSANNHAFSESNSLLGFWMLLVMWGSTRRVYDWTGLWYAPH